MSFNVSFNANQIAGPARGSVHTISAAYADFAVARSAADDLEKAGLRPTTITPVGPWTVTQLGGANSGILEHPVMTALIGAFSLGTITTTGALIWLDSPRSWLIYAGLGMIVGALTGSIASAIAAADHPSWHEEALGYSIGGLTVEVEADETRSAEVAALVMGRHGPTLFRSQTSPGPRPPSERVMWQHDDDLSPLEALGSWLGDIDVRGHRRGRHLEADRVGRSL